MKRRNKKTEIFITWKNNFVGIKIRIINLKGIKMIIDIDIPQKIEPEYKDKKTLTRVKEVYDLPEVQAIKGAVQEHLLFIGVDGKNNIKTINLLGIGDARSIIISPKYILRSAIINNCEKVVLVHNHPSNSLKASK